MNLLYTNRIDTTMLDQYIDPVILGNLINDRIHYIQRPENLVEVAVPDIYNYRPEKLSLEYYGHESFYPIILAANNIGTIFNFVPSRFNNKIKLVKSEVIQKIFNIT